MFLKSKFLGVALATCVAVPVLAFAGGGVPDCASAEVRKALDNNHRIKQVIEMGFPIKLSDFKTLSKDIKNRTSECDCLMSMKMDGEELKKRVKFTAEYTEGNNIVAEPDDIFATMFGTN